MHPIPVDEIQDGDVLATDALDASGKVLLGQGTVLSTKHRRILAGRGIASVVVRREGEEGGGSLPAAAGDADSEDEVELTPGAQRRMKAIEHAFAGMHDDELMRELCRLCLKHARQGLLRG